MSQYYPDPDPPCPESRRIAMEMLALLPPGLPPPELDYDMDGDTCMDWMREGNNVVSVSVSVRRRLACAWMSEAYGHSHGSEVIEFAGQFPPRLAELVRMIFPLVPKAQPTSVVHGGQTVGCAQPTGQGSLGSVRERDR